MVKKFRRVFSHRGVRVTAIGLRVAAVSCSVLLLVALTASEALCFQQASVAAEESRFLPKDQQVCNLLKDKARSGADIKAAVKTSIQLGYNSCLVVQCAIEGGGKVEEVIKGAMAAGATSDVVSRCAMDAGAVITDVVRGLQDGTSLCYVQPLGYSTPEGAPPVETIPPPPPSDPPHLSTYVP